MRSSFVIPLLSATLAAVAVFSLRRPAAQTDNTCYLLGDFDHRLTRVALDDRNPRTNETNIGDTGTIKTDAVAFQPRTGALFGVDVDMERSLGFLGTFDLATGAFQARQTDLGDGQGPLGTRHFFDVSGLAFDPVSGWLYATQIITGTSAPDTLFRVDPVSGQFVRGAFGGDDYVPLYPLPAYPELSDVDDITIDPATGQMYGILNNSDTGDRLIRINKQSGVLADVGAFGIAEVEGLAFDAHGRLWATAGGAPTGDRANALYAVDLTTGAASGRRPLDNSGNYEALACLVAAPDLTLALSERGEPAQPGSLLVYTLRYANTSNAPAMNVSVTQTLPLHTTFNAEASSPGWRRVDERVYVIEVGAVPANHQSVLNLAARVDEDVPATQAAFVTTATIGADGRTGLDLNNTDNWVWWKTKRQTEAPALVYAVSASEGPDSPRRSRLRRPR